MNDDVFAVLTIVVALAILAIVGLLGYGIGRHDGLAQGRCEGAGGVWVADGVEVGGETVHCIDAPVAREVER